MFLAVKTKLRHTTQNAYVNVCRCTTRVCGKRFMAVSFVVSEKTGHLYKKTQFSGKRK